MKVTVRRLGAALLAALVALGGTAPTAQAQIYPFSNRFPSNRPVITPVPVNPNFLVAPGLTLNQAAYNTAVVGRAISQIPPYALGYNPYTSPVVNTGTVVGGNPYTPPVYAGMVGTGGYGYPATASLSTNPYGYDSTLSTNPGAGTANPYGYGGYGEDPTAGFLRGTADVIQSTGNYYKNVQTARMIQTQADEGRIDYRRRLFDEANYERMQVPTAEQVRQKRLATDLDVARHQPPMSDIVSARALNDILNHLRNDPALAKGPNVPIDDEVLSRINVTSPAKPNASVGLLKDEGALHWPQPFQAKEFQTPRADMGDKLKDVVQNLKNGNPVPPGTLNDLRGDLAQLRKQVEKSELSPTDYIEAKGYLDQVEAAVQAAADPAVATYFNHKFNAKNVAELVDGMKGMDFAPAGPGDEWAYSALHHALVDYDYGQSPQAYTTQQTKQP